MKKVFGYYFRSFVKTDEFYGVYLKSGCKSTSVMYKFNLSSSGSSSSICSTKPECILVNTSTYIESKM